MAPQAKGNMADASSEGMELQKPVHSDHAAFAQNFDSGS
jgi:hypothetical protein